jgi:hypothetical protein
MTNEQLIQKFLDGATSGRIKRRGLTPLFIEGDTLYSYGKHYPLARRVGDKLWVNEDPSTKTTTKQRNLLFKLMERK